MMNIMKRYLFIGAVLLIAGTISAQNKYIGAEKCKACHNGTDHGNQYDSWLKDSHSQAIKTLSSEKAVEYAKKNGIADASKEAKCLKCHSTYDAVAPELRDGIKQDESVSCEGCHGAGSRYRSPAIMKNHSLAVRSGLIEQDEKLCLVCHNSEAPFHKEFDFKTAFEKVLHTK
ncbi:MAG: cytochrome c family protein [Bacteroidales bacterium]|jgi:excinuclease UvrABC ATPase subunit|nr:cytochrome c family protein [Bacteroidales bacterium]